MSYDAKYLSSKEGKKHKGKLIKNILINLKYQFKSKCKILKVSSQEKNV